MGYAGTVFTGQNFYDECSKHDVMFVYDERM